MSSTYTHDSILPQIELQVKQDLNNRNGLLSLADDCLADYNTARAKFIATGDAAAFRAAVAAEQDRQDLLAQVTGDGVNHVLRLRDKAVSLGHSGIQTELERLALRKLEVRP